MLSRAVWLDDYSVSNRPEGARGDGLPEYRDQLVLIKASDGREFPIWLQRIPRGDGALIWKISNRSVALIPELYDEFSYPPADERIRKWYPEELSFLGLEAFKWFILLVVALVSWPVLWFLGWLLSRLFSSPEKEVYPVIRRLFRGPFVLIGILVVFGILLNEFGAGAYAQQVMNARTLTTIAVVWVLWSLTNLYRTYKQGKLNAAGRPGAAKLMRPMTALIKLLILVFGLLFWLNNIGVNITTVLAGLGVGGLAVALALQRPIEDMMGALTIFSQAPMRVGDLVKYGNVLGLVENLSYRTKIRYQPTLRMRYDTSLDQLQRIRDGIRQMLEQHERVYDEPIRVRFTDFEEDAILIKVHCFMKTTDFTESLEIGEELNYLVMEIVESAGASFALPSSTMVIEGQRAALQP